MSQSPDTPKPQLTEKQLELEAINRWIELQSREIDSRKEERELQREQVRFAHEFAMESLKAQKEDLSSDRSTEAKRFETGLRYIVILVLIFAAFASVAIYLNKESVVKELMTYVALLVGGGGIGAFLSRRRKMAAVNPDE
ncbi:hypothetical protein [Nibricoccus sp. IMCC34717]|uniref:hypothetical protein n=1 Tax=Nibricoccus sp. IMCC34717 TaxID=3034021 RepID=UPI00384C435F